MNELAGKVAVVTGASKGIGAGIARALGSAGAAVTINYATDAAGAHRTADAILVAGGKAIAIQAGVSDAAEVKRLFEHTVKTFGRLDIVVNNAGVFKFGPLEDATIAEFHRHFDTNVLGPILTTQEALRHFPASGGSIINIGSIVSKNPQPGASIYAATKGAIDTLSVALANELGTRGIRVNTVAPGVTDTEGVRSAGIVGSSFETEMVSRTPLGRTGTPDDIAPLVVFLGSDDASWITGQRVNASGGLI
jgi:3-oxoacyl-[acyl-carrier protein] reductase